MVNLSFVGLGYIFKFKSLPDSNGAEAAKLFCTNTVLNNFQKIKILRFYWILQNKKSKNQNKTPCLNKAGGLSS